MYTMQLGQHIYRLEDDQAASAIVKKLGDPGFVPEPGHLGSARVQTLLRALRERELAPVHREPVSER
jgi:hypothetical protein